MMRAYLNYLKAVIGDRKGQGMVEYGLIVALVAVVVIVALTLMGTNLTDLFNQVAGKVAPKTTS